MSDPEDHIDAYTFIDRVDTGKRIDEVLRDVFEQNPDTVRFTAQFSGHFIGFVAMKLSGLAEAHELARGAFWDAGLRCETAHVIKASRIMIPKRGSPAVCALVQARAQDPSAVLDALDDQFGARQEAEWKKPYEEREFNYGAAVVSGTYDLLIDIGSTKHSKTIKLVHEEVATIPGIIGRPVDSYAHLPGNQRRRDL
jgi:hypothetical protein